MVVVRIWSGTLNLDQLLLLNYHLYLITLLHSQTLRCLAFTQRITVEIKKYFA